MADYLQKHIVMPPRCLVLIAILSTPTMEVGVGGAVGPSPAPTPKDVPGAAALNEEEDPFYPEVQADFLLQPGQVVLQPGQVGSPSTASSPASSSLSLPGISTASSSSNAPELALDLGLMDGGEPGAPGACSAAAALGVQDVGAQAMQAMCGTLVGAAEVSLDESSLSRYTTLNPPAK